MCVHDRCVYVCVHTLPPVFIYRTSSRLPDMDRRASDVCSTGVRGGYINYTSVTCVVQPRFAC